MSVRISATDWVPGGFDPDEAVAFARMLLEHGCDIVDVSSGQVSPLERPAFGRSFQTPFADRIRNEVGIPTIAVGAISSYDDVNTIIAAGRADLCALARPHLYDPHWTLHAAAEQGYDGRDVARPVPGGVAAAPDGPRRVAQGASSGRSRPRPLLATRAGVSAVVAAAGPLAAGEPFQPQDLVVTLLGTYVRPFGGIVWSGGLVVAAGGVRVLARRRAGRADAAGAPGADRPRALGAARALPDHAALRAAAARGRRADLLAGRPARRRRHVDAAVAPDSRGPAARAKPAGAAAALPRVRLGAGQRLGLAPRPLRRGGRAARGARRGGVRDPVPGARRGGRGAAARSSRGPGT